MRESFSKNIILSEKTGLKKRPNRTDVLSKKFPFINIRKKRVKKRGSR